MDVTKGTLLIKMFAQKIISRVAMLIMTNSCKGRAYKSAHQNAHGGVFAMETGTVAFRLCSSLMSFVWTLGELTLLLIGSLPLLLHTDF